MATTNRLQRNKGAAARPKMREKEASYHEVQAGLRAEREAEGEGAPPEAIEALMEGDSFTVPGTDVVLQRLNLQVVWAMEKVGSVYVGKEGSKKAITAQDIALGALCFADALGTWRLAKQGDKEALEEKAMELAGKLNSMEKLALANAWINAQFDRTQKNAGEDEEGSGAVGKKRPGRSAPAS